MLIATKANEILNTEDMFSYVFCTYPTALFDSPGVPRLANKAALADYLSNHIQIPAEINIKSTPRTRWWSPITVKDMTYQRRGQTNSVDVHCERSTAFTVKKGIFLSNKKSKQLFI